MYKAMSALHGVYYTKGYHTDLDTTKSIFAFSFSYKAYDLTDLIVLLHTRISPLYEGQRRTVPGRWELDIIMIGSAPTRLSGSLR